VWASAAVLHTSQALSLSPSLLTTQHEVEKMSKSKGNFILLKDAVERWGADA
jgi:leucyl-tRNA synthetase